MFKQRMMWTAILVTASCAIAGAAELSARGADAPAIFVAPKGRPTAGGTAEDPMDLQTALTGGERIAPGTTVWLLGGEYRGQFEHRCAGTKERPIVFRVAPDARATIVGGLQIHGKHTRFMGFEITNPNVVVESRFVDYHESDDVALVNLLLHDNGVYEVGHNGISCFSQATNSEICGCLIYNVGKGTRAASPHAHGIYTQNRADVGPKRIDDNMFFRVSGYGIHAYGSAQGPVHHFHLRRNIVFCNGTGALVGGGAPSTDTIFEENCLYGNTSVAAAFGYGGDGTSTGLTVRNNTLAGGPRPRVLLQLRGYRDAVAIEKNCFVALEAGPLVAVAMPDAAAYAWDGNAYWWGRNKNFSGIREPRLFALVRGAFAEYGGWQALGYDAHSTLSLGFPGVEGKPVNTVFVSPNRYQKGRGHVAVYNWEGKATVDLDLSAVLLAGEAYLVLDAQDYFGKPLAEGKWEKGTVAVPLPARDPSPEFAALVVLSGEAISYSCRGAGGR